uniref:Uncharacterized protein n=1 Tax=Phasianus colchicus TaxID=9054 RepID=A0A669QTX6_PHACC
CLCDRHVLTQPEVSVGIADWNFTAHVMQCDRLDNCSHSFWLQCFASPYRSMWWHLFCQFLFNLFIQYIYGFPLLQALVLCYFLETNSKQYNLVDKNVIEIGAGTGLVSIVASLLGALVTATDLPELLGNLQHNVLQNTKLKCKHQPCVKELSWGIDLEKNFPRASCHFDYIMAADVVYHHPFLDELLLTFDHLCKNDTVIMWAMKFRLDNENKFVDRFQTLFDLEEKWEIYYHSKGRETISYSLI